VLLQAGMLSNAQQQIATNLLAGGIQYICTLKSYRNHYFCAALQLHNSSVCNSLTCNWARELLKPSKDVASLLVWILKKWKFLDFAFFVGDIIWVRLSIFGPGYWALGANTKNQFFDSSF